MVIATDMTNEQGLVNEPEEDKYEDAGELDMSNAQQRLYLTRVPSMLWEALSKAHEDDEILLGTLRVQGDRFNPSRASLKLKEDTAAFNLVPKEFNMRPNSKAHANTFVFSEKNLPGYLRKSPGTAALHTTRPPSHEKSGINKYRGKGFRGLGFRKAIPKKTALVGHVHSEFICLPVENEQYAQVLELRARHIEKPKHELQVIDGKNNTSNMAVNAISSNSAFNTFIKGTPSQQKKQQSKAIRLPKNELRDALFRCFRAYKFWYIRDLKIKLQQPEPWLRECLEDIAELVRQGNHANTWKLKSSSALDPSAFEGASNSYEFDAAEEKVAPTETAYDGNSDIAGDPDEDDGEENGNVKMEDVNTIL